MWMYTCTERNRTKSRGIKRGYKGTKRVSKERWNLTRGDMKRGNKDNERGRSEQRGTKDDKVSMKQAFIRKRCMKW